MAAKLIFFAILLYFACGQVSGAQPAKPYRIGVLLPGGTQYETLAGLRQGLKALGMEEGKHFVLSIQDTQGDAKPAAAAAKSFEKENLNLIYALTTPIISEAKAATEKIAIVFAIGSDPVTGGLVNSFAQPGGRLTGVHYLVRDLTAKRLQILKEIMPKLARVITFYDPANRVAVEGAAMARDEANRIGVKLIERQAGSIDELKKKLDEIKAGEADAFFYTPDPMVGSQAQLIIEKTKAKKLPAMFQEQTLVAQGALASYGQNYREIGRASAKYVERVAGGAQPKDLKIETIDSVELAINLKTAKQLGLTVPPQMLSRAQKVIR